MTYEWCTHVSIWFLQIFKINILNNAKIGVSPIFVWFSSRIKLTTIIRLIIVLRILFFLTKCFFDMRKNRKKNWIQISNNYDKRSTWNPKRFYLVSSKNNLLSCVWLINKRLIINKILYNAPIALSFISRGDRGYNSSDHNFRAQSIVKRRSPTSTYDRRPIFQIYKDDISNTIYLDIKEDN